MAHDAVLHQPCPMRKTLSVLVLPAALLFALGLSACNPDVPVSDPTGPGEGTGAPTSAGGRTTSIADLRVGDCFNDESSADSDVDSVEVVDCSVPHQYEAYNNYDIPGSDFPEGEAMDREVRNGCYNSFAAYVGISYENSMYRINSFNPTAGSWAQGDRTITCTITTDDGSRITGSLKGAAR